YIWNIEIKVQDNMEIENIQQDLENIGLKKGILKKSIDTTQIINEKIILYSICLEGSSIEIAFCMV
ncbi:MAG: sporulation protein YqfD, partial [Clostridia bacterium]|nr:sporulation protein YqfD [Clostridia bacterium]